jgi:putative endonuclease
VALVTPDQRPGVGRRGEAIAAEFLQRRGYAIVERNFRAREGEIDLIAKRSGTLVFCEVKTRRAGGCGTPFDALHAGKQGRVRKMAASWLVQRGDRPRAPELRFDAIGVTIDARGRLVALDHLEGAF